MEEEGLTRTEQLMLGLSSAYYSVSRALKLRKLKDLLQSAQLAADTAVWLLGQCYPRDSPEGALHEEALTQLLLHFQSIIWVTYRTQFSPIAAGEVHLRSDAGWGCTLRSGQMIVAQALQRHWLGRDWRWPAAGAAGVAAGAAELEPPQELCRLLQLFWDAPSDRNPLSIHNLCAHGRPCGVHPGKWLGPWVMCHALERTASAAHQPLGVQVAVLAEPGGGAPLLSISRFEVHFTGSNEGSCSGEDPPGHQQQHNQQGSAAASKSQEGLLLLIPLVLGLGKLNPVYVPQLQSVLAMPQSVGIVGGRPGSSLYFVGFQGAAVLYLDPHEVQEAACSDGDWQSFHCDALRSMPLQSIDPSLALGFYCRDLAEYRQLCQQLAELERRAGGAPLLCVTEKDVPQRYDSPGATQWEPDEMSEEGEEELGSTGLGGEGVGGGEGGGAGVAREEGGIGGGEASQGILGEEMVVVSPQGAPQQPQRQQQQGKGGGGGGSAVAAAAGAEGAAASGSGEGGWGLPLSPTGRQASGRGGWELL